MSDPTPLPMRRLPKQTLHHVWAPKLARPVVLNSLRQLQLWTLLEANPGITRYVERPCEADGDAEGLTADFWALGNGRPTWLRVEGATHEQATAGLPAQRPSLVLVSAEELDRHRVWIQNWQSLLPYLSCSASIDLSGLRAQVVAFFAREASLEDAERHLAATDPVLVRAATIDGLHRGDLYSAELLVSPWTASLRIRQRP
jgi:hypothetical protein